MSIWGASEANTDGRKAVDLIETWDICHLNQQRRAKAKRGSDSDMHKHTRNRLVSFERVQRET